MRIKIILKAWYSFSIESHNDKKNVLNVFFKDLWCLLKSFFTSCVCLSINYKLAKNAMKRMCTSYVDAIYFNQLSYFPHKILKVTLVCKASNIDLNEIAVYWKKSLGIKNGSGLILKLSVTFNGWQRGYIMIVRNTFLYLLILVFLCPHMRNFSRLTK